MVNYFCQRSVVSLGVLALMATTALQATAADKSLETEYEEVALAEIASGLNKPWAVAFLPVERYLVTEREGRLVLVDGHEVTAISGTPEVKATNQGGCWMWCYTPTIKTMAGFT